MRPHQPLPPLINKYLGGPYRLDHINIIPYWFTPTKPQESIKWASKWLEGELKFQDSHRISYSFDLGFCKVDG